MLEMNSPRRIPDAESDNLRQPAEGVDGKRGTRRLVQGRVIREDVEVPAQPPGGLRPRIFSVRDPIAIQPSGASVRAGHSDGRVPAQLPREVRAGGVVLRSEQI